MLDDIDLGKMLGKMLDDMPGHSHCDVHREVAAAWYREAAQLQAADKEALLVNERSETTQLRDKIGSLERAEAARRTLLCKRCCPRRPRR